MTTLDTGALTGRELETNAAPTAVAAPMPEPEPEPEPRANEESPHHAGLALTLEQVDTLLKRHLPTSGGCEKLEKIELGFNNISFVATAAAEGGAQYVVRATRDSWPEEKVQCEMACIRLMRELTTLPVPTPLAFDASADEFGCRWILMEKMPGRVMSADEFDSLPEPAQARLTTQMVDFLVSCSRCGGTPPGAFTQAALSRRRWRARS